MSACVYILLYFPSLCSVLFFITSNWSGAKSKTMRTRINVDTEPDVRVITHWAQQDFVSYVQVFVPFYFTIRRPKNKNPRGGSLL